jgi:hypothetical protein
LFRYDGKPIRLLLVYSVNKKPNSNQIIPLWRTGEIWLQIITTAKISNKFPRESPWITRFQGSPQIFIQGFTCVNRVPVTQKIKPEKSLDFKIQIFEVWSSP